MHVYYNKRIKELGNQSVTYKASPPFCYLGLNMNKCQRYIISVIIFVAFVFPVAVYGFVAAKQSVSYYFPTTGTVVGNASKPPPSPIIDITNLLIIASSIVTILTGMLGLLWWMEWKSKYRKSRTPIVMPFRSKKQRHEIT